MPTILNEKNATFFCSALTGSISVTSGQNFADDGGGLILTTATQLKASGVCAILTAATGSPQQCKNKFSSWLGSETAHTINGKPVLNDMSKKICMACGVPTMVTVIPMVSVIPPAIENITDTKNNAAQTSPKTEKTVNSNETVSSEDTSDEDKKQEIKNTKADDGSINYEYAVCNYKNCKRAESCQYLKASHELEKITHPSQVLRANSKQKEDKFLEAINELKQKTQLDWKNAAHHIISTNQVFGKFPKLVKLANFYGYDINNAENCIFLPTKEDGFGERADISKKAQAYEVMSITGLQWHVSHHHYTIRQEDFKNVKDEERKNLKCYDEVLKSDIKNRIYPLFLSRNNVCRYDTPASESYAEKAERFKENMTSLSNDIEKKLLAFTIPKNSAPYFVSAEALRFTYNIPKRKKLMYIYSQNGSICFEKYIYTKNKGDKDSVLVSSADRPLCISKTEDNVNQIIEFCENVRHFFIYENAVSEIPFKTDANVYFISGHADKLYVSELQNNDFELNAEGYAVNTVMDKIKSFIATVAMKDESGYVAPQGMILKRRKECGLDVL